VEYINMMKYRSSQL